MDLSRGIPRDRDGGLGVLRGRAWDAVIDTSGYIPRLVRDCAELLRDNVHRYLFISTGDAYADFIKIGIDEDYTLDTIDDPTNEEPSKHYGPCAFRDPGWIARG